MLDYYLFKQIHDLYQDGRGEEARSILAELQERYIELHDENTLLRTQIQEYEDVLYLAKNLEYDGFSYWLRTGSIKQGPFCRTCYDESGLLIRLHEKRELWHCLTCGTSYDRSMVRTAMPPAGAEELSAKLDSSKVIHLFK